MALREIYESGVLPGKDTLAWRNHALQALHNSVLAITQELDILTVLRAVVKQSVVLLGAERGVAVFLRDDELGGLRLAEAVGLYADYTGMVIQPGEGLAGRVWQEQRPLVHRVPLRQHRARQEVWPPGAGLGVPLRTQAGLTGVLVLVPYRQRFDAADVWLAELFAAQVAVVIAQAQHHTAMQHELAVRQQQAQDQAQMVHELDAFAHTVAHDLKSPLAWVAGYADLLQEDGMLTPAERVESVQMIQQGAQKMQRIIDELLLLAAVRQQSDVPRQPLNMRAVPTEVRLRLAPLLDEAQAVFVLPDGWPPVLGYAPWIEQVWTNYISNAIKYGGTPPRIELGAASVGDQVCFWVQDNGLGLSADEMSRLFVPFTRLRSLHDDRQHGGHGLGVSIVRRIVERLGGTVGVESAPGQGSRFMFSLPACQAANGTAAD